MLTRKTIPLLVVSVLLWVPQALGDTELDEIKDLNQEVKELTRDGEYGEALLQAQKALEFYNKYKSDIEKDPYAMSPDMLNPMADAFNNLGLVHRNRDNPHQARQNHQEALKLHEIIESRQGIAVTRGYLGWVHMRQGRFDKALKLIEEAERNLKDLQKEHPRNREISSSLAVLLNDKIELYRYMRHYAKAEEEDLYNKGLRLAQKVPETTAALHVSQGLFLKDKKDYPGAQKLLEDARKIIEKLNPEHPQITKILIEKGRIYILQENWIDAKECLSKDPKFIGMVEFYLAQDDPRNAWKCQQKATEPGEAENPRYKVHYYHRKGRALAGVGNWYLQEAAEGRALAADGHAYLKDAALNLLRAIKEIESLRERVPGERQDFFKGFYIRPYRSLVAVLAKLHEEKQDLPEPPEVLRPQWIDAKKWQDPKAAAFSVAEATKARVLLEAMTETAKKTTHEELRPHLQAKKSTLDQRRQEIEANLEKAREDKAAPKEIEEWQNKRMQLEAEEKEFIQELRQANPVYAELHYPQAVPEASDLHLQEDEVLLEYALGEKYSYVFVVRQDGVQDIFPIGIDKDSVEDKVETCRAYLMEQKGFSLKKWKEEAKTLYIRLLGKPLEFAKLSRDEREKIKRVIIVPDGKLGLLPFEALMDDQGTFVGDRYILTYYQSAAVMALQRTLPEKKGKRMFFALGHPIFHQDDPRWQGKLLEFIHLNKYSYGNYDPLPYTGEEVTEIADFFKKEYGPAAVRTLLNEQANEKQLWKENLDQYRYLHFSTHADWSGKVPEPFILLGLGKQTNEKPDLLTLSKVININPKLRAQMVLLNCCGTGVGEVVEGEGVMNFARAFHHAGAQSVVVSLWKVEVGRSAEIMKDFYKKLLDNDGKDRAAALTEVRRIYKEKNKNQNPFSWAVFILHGEGAVRDYTAKPETGVKAAEEGKAHQAGADLSKPLELKKP